ncbi:hypothetical protein [Colwellia psychrerythraea]|uniref:Uncharacterized protein n=1 Tax=Colwellia psychrerythraea TaxID=28229 RepID=A0A099K7S6_COLPS|nr:hypothetical protein [Colwellia psychrerythraea]KGJ86426.1 hypothetical protein ND2E_0992 [Colwellia psychrerythraea]
MPRRNNNHQPPQVTTPHSGASESTHLQWVIQNQNELSGRTAAIETDVSHICSTLERIEGKLDKQDERIQKNSTTLKIASAIVVTAAAVIWFMVDGKLGKIHEYMEHNDAKAPTVQAPTKKKPN